MLLLHKRIKLFLLDHWVKIAIASAVVLLLGAAVYGLSTLESFYRHMTLAAKRFRQYKTTGGGRTARVQGPAFQLSRHDIQTDQLRLHPRKLRLEGCARAASPTDLKTSAFLPPGMGL